MIHFPRQHAFGIARDLPLSQREKLKHRRATGQAFGDLLHEEQVLRAGEDELAGLIAPRIYLFFDVGQQIWSVLDLIVDHRRRIEPQKPTRITDRRGADIGRLQGDDRPLRTDHVLKQRRLTRLARADQNDDRKLGHGPGKDWFQAPGDVVLHHNRSFRAYLQLYCKYARKARLEILWQDADAQIGSLKSLVMHDEIIAMTRRVMRGIESSDDALMLDLIDQVGPGGEFMSQEVTAKRCRAEIWNPTLMDRQRWDVWAAAGSKTAIDRIRAKLKKILARHPAAAAGGRGGEDRDDFAGSGGA